LQNGFQPGCTFTRADFRIGSPHIGFDPTGVQAYGADTAIRQVNGQAFNDLVYRGFRTAVDVLAAAAVIGDAAHLAAHYRHQLLLTGRNLRHERLYQHQRCNRIDLEHPQPFLRIDRAETRASWTVDARITQQYIDRPVGKLLRQGR
jgi:hypothetical protein